MQLWLGLFGGDQCAFYTITQGRVTYSHAGHMPAYQAIPNYSPSMHDLHLFLSLGVKLKLCTEIRLSLGTHHVFIKVKKEIGFLIMNQHKYGNNKNICTDI